VEALRNASQLFCAVYLDQVGADSKHERQQFSLNLCPQNRSDERICPAAVVRLRRVGTYCPDGGYFFPRSPPSEIFYPTLSAGRGQICWMSPSWGIKVRLVQPEGASSRHFGTMFLFPQCFLIASLPHGPSPLRQIN